MSKRFEQAKKYTQKYKEILFPCHVCGNKDIRIVSDRGIFPPRNLWSVCCSNYACECTGSYISVKEAIQQWNKMNKENKND